MKFISCATVAFALFASVAAVRAEPIPSVPDIISDIQGDYWDFSDPAIRSLIAQEGNLHFLTLQLSLLPAESLPADAQSMQATISSVLGKCAQAFELLSKNIETSKEARIWQLSIGCLNSQNFLEGVAMGQFHDNWQFDPTPYASLADLIDTKVSAVLSDY